MNAPPSPLQSQSIERLKPLSDRFYRHGKPSKNSKNNSVCCIKSNNLSR